MKTASESDSSAPTDTFAGTLYSRTGIDLLAASTGHGARSGTGDGHRCRPAGARTYR
ncbi:hypothetical protein Ae168Ps1_5767c [Pseudonocardia sp. Ae168_Ps1]|nr:hypothetical protein Ae168Ps1_5767c [Pseudonocardia sp. Ae168_Ps1]